MSRRLRFVALLKGLTGIFLFFNFFMLELRSQTLHAQPLEWPNSQYLKQIYNPQTKSVNISYDYSGLWDLDGDKIKDSVFFIGNGGVHIYFYPRFVLSQTKRVYEYPTINLDMPYLDLQADNDTVGNSVIQFVVKDYNTDGVFDVYLNFDNSWSQIPKAFKKKVKNKNVVLDFSGKNLLLLHWK